MKNKPLFAFLLLCCLGLIAAAQSPVIVANSTAGGSSSYDDLILYRGAFGVSRVRLSWQINQTEVAPEAATIGPVTISYTDYKGVSQSVAAKAILADGTFASSADTNTVNTLLFGVPLILRVKPNTAITMTVNYVSVPASSGGWNVFYLVESLPQ